MIKAPLPTDEAERLADLRALKILDTPAEARFDRLVGLATAVLDAPIAYIALVDADRQWFKAKCGFNTNQTDRSISFCGHTIMQSEPLIISDATKDERFVDNPMVLGEPFVRFYAGYPLRGPSGRIVGTFCVVDHKPRNFDAKQLVIFKQLAALAEHELKLVDLIQAQRELIETKNALALTQKYLAQELAQAAAYVRSLLPAPLEGKIRSDWKFISSSQLGGDLFGYDWLDADHLAVYLLDVCGHGVGAALLSISIHTALRRQTLPGTDFHDPAAVLNALNRAFPMEEHGGKFFTIWYGVYNPSRRNLAYACAGHPPALIFRHADTKPIRLGGKDLMVGIDTALTFSTFRKYLEPGTRMYLYSDGVFEVKTKGRGMLSLDGLEKLLAQAGSSHHARVEQVYQSIRTLNNQAPFADDFSLLELEV